MPFKMDRSYRKSNDLTRMRKLTPPTMMSCESFEDVVPFEALCLPSDQLSSNDEVSVGSELSLETHVSSTNLSLVNGMELQLSRTCRLQKN
ncbi:unnamed protein product [Bursaphelenchus okinawaensis]|uniref:Uncharacterized protein n=1 Tax=Bursaphelenchus okinawaensis TaxID=465554 RepID=A0A811KRW6_9BILA|nr:unnamed protein product [Bursaphelenchus okinawaensis]CAG9110801.1 unnamed protein product [Bursaphelenchus okinawaensis]